MLSFGLDCESDFLDRSQRSIPLYRSGGLLIDVGFNSLFNRCSSVSYLPLSLDVFVFGWLEFRGRIVVGVEAVDRLKRHVFFSHSELYTCFELFLKSLPQRRNCCLEKL
ncbi:unnamed protein product [Brassica oleracea]|uniref:(rape) hypothetical protein n=1 Tax=Brassica napus TaxID=3708 RepID=A0A816USR8_BRANA|nr:unnamed protein product [Brassica napus]